MNVCLFFGKNFILSSTFFYIIPIVKTYFSVKFIHILSFFWLKVVVGRIVRSPKKLLIWIIYPLHSLLIPFGTFSFSWIKNRIYSPKLLFDQIFYHVGPIILQGNQKFDSPTFYQFVKSPKNANKEEIQWSHETFFHFLKSTYDYF